MKPPAKIKKIAIISNESIGSPTREEPIKSVPTGGIYVTEDAAAT
jgi:hypothetical protein